MWRILVSAVVAIVPLSAQISRESLLRYGEPYVQRFRTAPEISITVRYGPTGEVCAVRIAPAESAGTEAPPQDGFDALTVNAVAKRFVSGSRDPHDEGRQAPSSELSLEEQSDGWRVARYHGYPIDADGVGAVTLTAYPRCSTQTRSSIEQRYGSPEYERFSVQPGMMWAVRYGRGRSVKRLDLRRYSTSLDDEPLRSEDTVALAVADRVVDEFLGQARQGLQPGYLVKAGVVLSENFSDGRIMLSRYSIEGKYVGYSLTWD